MSAFIETFGAGEQQLADPIQRVGLAASVSEGLVLHAAADAVDAAVRDAHHMEGVGDALGVIKMWREPGPEALGEIGGNDLDARQPSRIGAFGPSAQVSGTVALD